MTTLEVADNQPRPEKRKENTQDQAPSIPNPCRSRVHESTPLTLWRNSNDENKMGTTSLQRHPRPPSLQALLPSKLSPCFQKHKTIMLIIASHRTRPLKRKSRERGIITQNRSRHHRFSCCGTSELELSPISISDLSTRDASAVFSSVCGTSALELSPIIPSSGSGRAPWVWLSGSSVTPGA